MRFVLRQKLTVIIPAYNEEINLPDALRSVAWADEIIVVDSFSTDKTTDIAVAAGARVLSHEFVNDTSQKNWAIAQATHPWVMCMDADERVPAPLRDELLAFLEDPGDVKGLRLYRQNHLMDKPIHYCDWQNDSVLRVFPRDEGGYPEDRLLHADAQVNGKVKACKARLDHYTFRSFDQYLKKVSQYTAWAARDRDARTGSCLLIPMLTHPVWRFFKQYILRGGILDGVAGLIICVMSAFSVFLKYARIWELRRLRKSADASRFAQESCDGHVD